MWLLFIFNLDYGIFLHHRSLTCGLCYLYFSIIGLWSQRHFSSVLSIYRCYFSVIDRFPMFLKPVFLFYGPVGSVTILQRSSIGHCAWRSLYYLLDFESPISYVYKKSGLISVWWSLGTKSEVFYFHEIFFKLKISSITPQKKFWTLSIKFLKMILTQFLTDTCFL